MCFINLTDEKNYTVGTSTTLEHCECEAKVKRLWNECDTNVTQCDTNVTRM
jgi:hypothetical protein